MKKLIIFDVDGTILDTLETIAYHVNKALEDFGYRKLDVSEYRYILGNGPVYLVREALRISKGAYEEESKMEEVLNHYDKLYRANPLYLTKPYDGMEVLLKKLKEEGYLLSAFSNKQDRVLKKIFNQMFEKDLFDMVLGQRENIKRKPDPQGLIYILDRLRVDKEDALLIGDTEVDIGTGKNAGVFTLACTWGFRTKEDLIKISPDAIIEEIGEIFQYI